MSFQQIDFDTDLNLSNIEYKVIGIFLYYLHPFQTTIINKPTFFAKFSCQILLKANDKQIQLPMSCNLILFGTVIVIIETAVAQVFQTFYVNSSMNCNFSCSGTLDDPFLSLGQALNKTLGFPNLELLLLNSNEAHQILIGEEQTSQSYKTPSIFQFQSLRIAPFYGVGGFLINEQVSIIVKASSMLQFVANSTFNVSAPTTLELSGLNFDFKEDIYLMNNISNSTINSEVLQCLMSRVSCCNSSTNLNCYWKSNSKYEPNSKITSFFNFENSFGSTILNIERTNFENLVNPYMTSLFLTATFNMTIPTQFNFSLFDVTFNKIFLDQGIFYHFCGSNLERFPFVLTIIGGSLNNYNPSALQTTSKIEGYLFKANTEIYLLFSMENFVVQNTTPSTRNRCPSINSSSDFIYPLNNELKSYQFSRSNLWNLYNADILRQNTSSLIYIKSLSGQYFIINNCSFTKIIGLSGSVLNINDITTSNILITIKGSRFDQNFAYMAFSNIIISRISGTFASMFQAPNITIFESNFTNAFGCPGSYGNVLLANYWDYTPPTTSSSLSNYSDPSQNFTTFSFSTPNPTQALLTISLCNFESNMMAISNSLAIIGFQPINLESNFFIKNGGPTLEIITEIFKNYFLSQVNLELSTDFNSTNHFGQSSVIFIDRIATLISKQNAFEGNFAYFEGSLSLGVIYTIKNVILLGSSINLSGDIYINQSSNTPYDPILSGYSLYKPSLSTLSVDWTGQQIFSNLSSHTIKMEQISFSGNVFNSSLLANDTYNNQQIGIFFNSEASNLNYKTLFFRMMSSYDNIDLIYSSSKEVPTHSNINFNIIDSYIVNNSIKSLGNCLFSTGFATSTVLNTSNILSNTNGDLSLYESPNFTQLLLSDTSSFQTGLFCAFSANLPSGNVQFSSYQNEYVLNKGQLVAGIGSAQIEFENNIFQYNQAESNPLIALIGPSQFCGISNSTFSNNQNAYGSIMILDSSTIYEGFNNTYSNIIGGHAVIGFINSGKIKETQSTVTETMFNLKYPLFKDGVTCQGGIFYAQNGELELIRVNFYSNPIPSGIISAIQSGVIFDSCNVSNNNFFNIEQLSIVGTFTVSSFLIFQNGMLSDSYLNASLSFSIAFFRIINSELTLLNSKIEKLGLRGGAGLVFTNDAYLFLSNLTINDVKTYDNTGGGYLFLFINSEVWFNYSTITQTTNIFDLTETKANLYKLNISNMSTNIGTTQVFLEGFNSITSISFVSLYGNGDINVTNPIISYFGATLYLAFSNFVNFIHFRSSSLISGQDMSQLYVLGCNFINSEVPVTTTLFQITSVGIFLIEGNIFVLPGQFANIGSIGDQGYIKSNIFISDSTTNLLELSNFGDLYSIEFNKFIGNYTNSKYAQPKTTGIILITDPEKGIYFDNNLFLGFSNDQGTINIESLHVPASIFTFANTFVANTAINGSAIKCSLSPSQEGKISLLIQSSTFLSNFAQSYGGAIYLGSENPQNLNLTEIQNTYLHNYAGSHGGAIYFVGLEPIFSNSSEFQNNTIQNGILNHVGTIPARLIKWEKTNPINITYIPNASSVNTNFTGETLVWNNLQSANPNKFEAQFALLDMFGQTVYDDNSSALQIMADGYNSSTIVYFSPLSSLIPTQGIYTMSNFKWVYKVGSTLFVHFTATSINLLNKEISFIVNPINQINVSASFSNCGLGQVLTGQNSCEDCNSGLWLVNIEENSEGPCEICDPGMYCLGGSDVGPRQGYWRYNTTANIVIQCPYPPACVGNNEPESLRILQGELNPVGTCGDSYFGNLCNKCYPGHAKFGGQGECIDCHNDPIVYLKLVGIIFAESILIIGSIKGTIFSAKKYKFETAGDDPDVIKSVLFRILTDFIQVLAVLGSIPVSWPNSLSQILDADLKVANLAQFLSLDCFFALASGGSDFTSLRLIFNIIIPLIIVIFASIGWIAMYIARRKSIRNNSTLQNKIIITSLILCFNMQPTVIQTCLQFFHCQNLYRDDRPLYFLTTNYDLECWTGDHLLWSLVIVVPGIIFWLFLLPGFLLSLLHKNKLKLQDPSITEKYSFIYAGYRAETYYWEFIIMVRKVAIISINVFVTPELQAYIASLVVLFSYYIQDRNLPYLNTKLNKLEILSIANSIAMTMGGIYFSISASYGFMNVLVLIAVFISTLGFFAIWLRYYFSTVLNDMKKKEEYKKVVTKYYGIVKTKLSKCINRPKKIRVKDTVRESEKLNNSVSGITDQTLIDLKNHQS